MRILKSILSVICFCLCVFGSAVNGEAAKKVIAVLGVTNSVRTHAGQLVAQEFNSAIQSELVNSGVFTVVERDYINQVVSEIGRQHNGMFDENSVVEFGHMTGADLTFMANVVGANVSRVDNVVYKSVKAKAQVNIKVIDNKTGVIKVSEMVVGNKSVLQSLNPDPKVLLSGAVKEAVEKATKVLIDLNPLVGAVIKVDDESVYVNLGTNHGVHVGDRYVVFEEGEALIDPGTGNVIGVFETVVANAKVIRVQSAYSVMELSKIKGTVTRKCKVRKVGKD